MAGSPKRPIGPSGVRFWRAGCLPEFAWLQSTTTRPGPRGGARRPQQARAADLLENKDFQWEDVSTMSLAEQRRVMANDKLDTNQKARQINLDANRYGTFAEIGAGQEVVRWFFRAGGAAGTVAKTISAYDMAVSDAIYGPTDYYVSRQRLRAMLDYEYELAPGKAG